MGKSRRNIVPSFCQTEGISMLYNELIHYKMAECSKTSKAENKSIKLNIILKLALILCYNSP